MIGRMRTATAALVGALCGAGCFASLEPSAQLLCRGSEVACVLPLVFLLIPVLVIFWVVVGWLLLRLARFSPAWATAGVGTVGAAVLLAITVFMQIRLPAESAIFVVAIEAAVGYALAAEVTARYGVPRDRTEHRGQDG